MEKMTHNSTTISDLISTPKRLGSAWTDDGCIDRGWMLQLDCGVCTHFHICRIPVCWHSTFLLHIPLLLLNTRQHLDKSGVLTSHTHWHIQHTLEVQALCSYLYRKCRKLRAMRQNRLL